MSDYTELQKYTKDLEMENEKLRNKLARYEKHKDNEAKKVNKKRDIPPKKSTHKWLNFKSKEHS